MRIHILADDMVRKRRMLAEHGLSILIEHRGRSLLFDTGQSDVYLRNAQKMGFSVAGVSHIILSHGHYDHAGGLVHYPFCEGGPKIYLQESALLKKYAVNADEGTYREVGFPFSLQGYPEISEHLTIIRGVAELAPDTVLVGDVPFTVPFEKEPKNFYTGDAENKQKDTMRDEQLLVIDTEKGLYVFLGCSHPGVINCLHAAQAQFPNKKIHALIAGMHLEEADPERLQRTMQEMLSMDIDLILPLHCTGLFAICDMARFFRERCIVLHAGETAEI